MHVLKKLILSTVFLLMGTCLTAQKQMNEVTLHYKISVDAKSERAGALNGATMKVFLKGSLSKNVMESKIGKEINVFNGNTGKGFILKSYSGQQLMITLTRDNWMQKNKLYPSLKFTITDTDEKFGNYTLKKATTSLPGGRTYTVFFTPDLILVNKDYNNAFPQLPGIPVRYSVVSGDVVFTYTLEKIDTDLIQPSFFEEPKSGYRIMTYEENLQLRKDGGI
jgi:hypothetical protein